MNDVQNKSIHLDRQGNIVRVDLGREETEGISSCLRDEKVRHAMRDPNRVQTWEEIEAVVSAFCKVQPRTVRPAEFEGMDPDLRTR